MASSPPRELNAPSKDAKTPLDKLRYDQGPMNFTPSQAGTSYAGSVAAAPTSRASTQGDDASSKQSVYSYDSQRDSGMFVKEVEGRTFNVLNETYYLPTDDAEWSRLDKQHVAIRLGLSNFLYPDPQVVQCILRPEQDRQKRILDLGCGTGVWTIEMAREFPEAEVIGVDLAPCPVDPESLPPNCRFEIDNVNLGLAHFRDQFDFIHCRLIASGIQDFKKSMRDVEMCLRPGGMVVWMDVDFDMYSNNRFLYRHFATEENPSGSWFQRITFEMRRQAAIRGSDLYTTAKELDAGFWGHELLDPETCRTASLYLPLGPWAQCRNQAQTQQLLYTGALMRQDASSMHKAIHPMLVRSGWPQEVVSEWSRKADEELNGTKEPLWSRLMVAWGRRRAAPGEPAPPLSAPSPRTRGDAEEEEEHHLEPHRAHIPYPNYYVYKTQEHSLRQAAYRNKQKNIPPPPLPDLKPEEDEVPNTRA